RRSLWGLAMARVGVERLARASARRGQRHLAGVHPLRAILRHRADDGDLLADRERLTAPAAALQTVRRTHFGAPVRDFAGLRILHVDIEPHVRIRPLDL